MTNVRVHVTHCCAAHGCKYGDADCPVALLEVAQEGPCLFCEPEEPGEVVEFAVMNYDYVANDGSWFVRTSWTPSIVVAVQQFLRARSDMEGWPAPIRIRLVWRRVHPVRSSGVEALNAAAKKEQS